MGPGGGWGHPFPGWGPGWGSAGGGFLQADCASVWPLSLRSSSVLQTTPSHRLPSLQLLLPDPRDSAHLQAATCHNDFYRLSTAPGYGWREWGSWLPRPSRGWMGDLRLEGHWGQLASGLQQLPGVWARDSFPLPSPGAASRPWGLFLALSPQSRPPQRHADRGWIFKCQSRKALPHGFLHSFIQRVVIEHLLYTRPSAGAGWGPRGQGEQN